MMLATFLGKQAAYPRGFFGQFLMTRLLNRVNINMNRFALDRAELCSADSLLDLGCGGGDLVHRALKQRGCDQVMGIDASHASVKHCRHRMRRAIRAQKAHFEVATAVQIPSAQKSFSCVTSSSTIYFFCDLAKAFLECRRVLKTRGKFVICFNDAAWLRKQAFAKQGFRCFEVEEVETLLKANGFGHVSTEHRQDRLQGLIHCTVATRLT